MIERWESVGAAAAKSAATLGTMIQELGAIGGGNDGSVSRLAFTTDERQAHALVGDWLAKSGWQVDRDSFGNTIANRAGRRDLPPIAFGSHADSVPVGGRFDGAAGVVMSVLLGKLIADANVQTEHPLRVVVFAAEEGARFGEPCLGSKAVTGVLSSDDTGRLVDHSGVTLAEAMLAVGFDPTETGAARWDDGEISLFLEPHIEQGRILQDAHADIGIVDAITGSARLRLRLIGRAGHSGGTPMHRRRDALAAAAEVVALVEALGRRYARGTAATVGRLSVWPNNITTVPGEVELYIDVRDVDELHLQETVQLATDGVQQIAQSRDIDFELVLIAHTIPAHLWGWVRQVLRESCVATNVQWRILNSGAGHDAQIVARRFPAAMLFVPSRDGASHVPWEWTEPQQLALGLTVMAGALERADRLG